MKVLQISCQIPNNKLYRKQEDVIFPSSEDVYERLLSSRALEIWEEDGGSTFSSQFDNHMQFQVVINIERYSYLCETGQGGPKSTHTNLAPKA